MICALEYIGEDGGRHVHRCTRKECGRVLRLRTPDASDFKARCGVSPPLPPPIPSSELTPVEIANLFPGETDPMLLGNRIAALTAAIGIPECGGCKKRKAWLNKAHAWLKGCLSSG